MCWDDPEVDWDGYDLAVIRSTWDYSWRAAEFVAWAERCGQGSPRWRTRPRWCAGTPTSGISGDLAAAGVPVVPTRYLAPRRRRPDLPADREYVVKPTSGAGARYAARYTPEDHDEGRTAARADARGGADRDGAAVS